MSLLSAKQGGGLIYRPPMMLFNGTTGYYSHTFTSSGNKVAGLIAFNIASFSGGGAQYLMHVRSAANRDRLAIVAMSNDHANADFRDNLLAISQNSSGTNICRLVSQSGYLDAENHTLLYSFDGDAGTAVFRIDRINADDTGNASRIAPTTGTLDSGASTDITIGAFDGGSNFANGRLGFAAHRQSYVTDYAAYMDRYGNPRQTDFSSWLYGHFAAKMDENQGTAGAMTKNGGITLTDPGPVPHIGLPTVGTAVAADIASGKTAWVNGVEIVGTAV